MTLAAFVGRCHHCGHDHGSANRYVPVLERHHDPTAHDEMLRLLDLCASLGRENEELRRLAVAIATDPTEPAHRRQWARELLPSNV
jgi:hypothetical protein